MDQEHTTVFVDEATSADLADIALLDGDLATTIEAPARARPARRGREARRAARQATTALTKPYFVRNTPPVEVLDEAALAIIEANAERLLQEVGIEVRDYPRAKELFRAAGCDVRGDRVRFPLGLARALCKTAPSQFTQHARNPGAQLRDWRQEHRLRAGLRLTVRA